MQKLTKQLQALKNMSDFARKSGIPRRTLDRIKLAQGEPSKTTQLALTAALKAYKEPK